VTPDLLTLEGIHKYYGRFHVLHGIDFSIKPGESVGLVGDNGAGKSTLIKTISGYIRPDRGRISFEGREVRISSPAVARKLGIETVYQEQALAPDISISRNIFMGRELVGPAGFLRMKEMNERSMAALTGIGLTRIRSADTEVGQLSGGQRQGVAIARALCFDAKLVILDEPTVALSVKEVHEVLEFVRRLTQKGVAVIFITHNLHHVFSIVDRLVVVSHGTVAANVRTEDSSVEDCTRLITEGTMGSLELARVGGGA
jgi:simple sugar transport system ATP-binding protein